MNCMMFRTPLRKYKCQREIGFVDNKTGHTVEDGVAFCQVGQGCPVKQKTIQTKSTVLPLTLALKKLCLEAGRWRY
jgi:hypothetical protein